MEKNKAQSNIRILFDNKNQKIHYSTVYAAPYLKYEKVPFVNLNYEEDKRLEIELDYIPESVVIRPKSANVEYSLNGNKIVINKLSKVNISIEPDGDYHKAILVFSYNINIDESEYKHIIRYNEYMVNAGTIEIENDNTLLILDDDAYINGRIIANNKKHIAITGGGVLTMENYERYGTLDRAIDIQCCTDVKVQNIVISDSCNWSLRVEGCENVVVDNVKSIGCRQNSDGCDICGSRHVWVKSMFTRVWDDSFVLKAFNTGDVYDVVFEDCVLWNDFARPIEVGVELRAEKVHDVTFRNIDIIHSPTGYPLLGIHHGDRAEVYNITYENIRAEDTPGAQLFDLRITDSVWNKDTVKGYIHDVLIKDIYLDSNNVLFSDSRIQGFDEKSTIENVKIENVRIDNKAIKDISDLGLLVYDYTDNIEYIAGDAPYLDKVNATMKYENSAAMVVLNNPNDRPVCIDATLVISPSASLYSPVVIKRELTPNEMVEAEYDIPLPAGKFCLHLESELQNISQAWCYVENDLVLGTDIEKAVPMTIETCRGERICDIQLALNGDTLIVKSDRLENGKLTIYGANPVAMAPNQIVFSVEETGVAESPALLNGPKGIESAPQIRIPEEVTYVFENEPKTKITSLVIGGKAKGITCVHLDELGINSDADSFWIEISADTDLDYRYMPTLFHSENPREVCHMFANVKRRTI